MQRKTEEKGRKQKTGKVEHSTGKERLKRVGSETKMKKCMLGTFLIQRINSNKEEEENDARK